MRVLQSLLNFSKGLVKSALIFVIIWSILQYTVLQVTIVTIDDYNDSNHNNKTVSLEDNLDVINVLIWSKNDIDFESLRTGQEAFIKSKCDNINCYVTSDRHFLGEDYSLFDAVLINSKDVNDLPKKRSPHQKYVFATRDLEYNRNPPLCDKIFDNYFNLTFTPKLDSDVVWSYFPIVIKYQETINLSIDSEAADLKTQNRPSNHNLNKLYSAIYIRSNCSVEDNTSPMAAIIKEMKRFYIDVKIVCTEDCSKIKDCEEDLHQYYFYFVVEDKANLRRLVSETLVAVHHNTIPVILAPTDYSSHLPKKSFINAWKLGPRNTAVQIARLISNETEYMDYFKWKRSPVYRSNMSSECQLCARLNKNYTKTYKWLRDWWNPAKSRCIDDWMTVA